MIRDTIRKIADFLISHVVVIEMNKRKPFLKIYLRKLEKEEIPNYPYY